MMVNNVILYSTPMVSSTKQIIYFQLYPTLQRPQHCIKANRTEGIVARLLPNMSAICHQTPVSYNTAIYRTFPGIIAVVNRITHNNYRRPSAPARDPVRSVWSIRIPGPVRRRVVPTPSWARSENAPTWKPFLWHSDQKTINFGVTLSLGWWFRFCAWGARVPHPRDAGKPLRLLCPIGVFALVDWVRRGWGWGSIRIVSN